MAGAAALILAHEATAPAAVAQPAASAPEENAASGFFPPAELVSSPWADVRQPRFGASVARIDVGSGTSNFAAVAFGDSWGVWRSARAPSDTLYQVGVEAAVFALFDLEAGSQDLWNADYVLAIPLTALRRDFGVRVRAIHTSSHLGDEFLLREQIVSVPKRIEVSYESIEALAFWRRDRWRIYGGSEYIVHTSRPLDRWLAQAGFEWLAAKPILANGRLYAALDLQSWEETDYDVDVSASAGLVFANPWRRGGTLRVFVEFYDGRLQQGQLYVFDSRWYGLGVALDP